MTIARIEDVTAGFRAVARDVKSVEDIAKEGRAAVVPFGGYAAVVATPKPSIQTRISAIVAGRLVEWIRLAGGTCLGGGWAPAGDVRAAHWGFDAASGTAAQNRTAIQNAVAYTQGRQPVHIDVPVDYLCDRIDAASGIWAVFVGAGRMDRTGGGVALRVQMEMQGVQPVSAITDTTFGIEGNSEAVTALTVTDASQFPRGTMVKILSDDIDPDSREGYTSRRGEIAKVHAIDPATNRVFIARALEDRQFYTSNVRLVRYLPDRVRIENFRVRSAPTNGSVLVHVQAAYRPHVEVTAETHGATVLQANGCAMGRFHVDGQSLGNAAGSLGYMVSDRCGTDNAFFAGIAAFCRHATTTITPSVEAGSTAYHDYGTTRGAYFRDFISEGSQNVPFDEHEGARRTVWENCKARNGLLGTNLMKVGFQLRGRDSTVIGPDVDGSYDAMVNPTREGRGKHKVIGGRGRCPLVASNADALPKTPVEFVGTDTVCASNVGLVIGGALHVTISGGTHRLVWAGPSGPRALGADFGTQVILNRPRIETEGTHTSFRLVNVGAAGGRVRGECDLSHASVGSITGLFVSAATAGASVHLRVAWLNGNRPGTMDSGTWDVAEYELVDFTRLPLETRKSPSRMIAGGASLALSVNQELAFQRVSDTTLRIMLRGADGVTRGVNLTLAP